MFGLGTWEIVLILLAALVFIGPSKLPDLARSLGKGMRDVRRAMAGFETEIRRATDISEEPEDAAPPGLPAGREAGGPKRTGDSAVAGGEAATLGDAVDRAGQQDALGRVSAAKPTATAWHRPPSDDLPQPGDAAAPTEPEPEVETSRRRGPRRPEADDDAKGDA